MFVLIFSDVTLTPFELQLRAGANPQKLCAHPVKNQRPRQQQVRVSSTSLCALPT
jgi:hypothetical protein